MEMSLVVVKHHDIKQNFDIHQIFKLASKIKQFIKVIAGGKYTNSETQKTKHLQCKFSLSKFGKYIAANCSIPILLRAESKRPLEK